VQRIERQLMVAGEGLAERIERAGTDITEDDADRSDRQLEHAVGVMIMTAFATGVPGAVMAAGVVPRAGQRGRYGSAHER
jgi:hypothetical protein